LYTFTGIERVGDEKLRPKITDPRAGNAAKRTDEDAVGAPLREKAPPPTPTPAAPAAPPASTTTPTPTAAPRAVLGGTLCKRPLSSTRPRGR